MPRRVLARVCTGKGYELVTRSKSVGLATFVGLTVALIASSSASAQQQEVVRNLRITPGAGSLGLRWSATRSRALGFLIRYRALGPRDLSLEEPLRPLASAWSAPVELPAQARRYTITGLAAEPYEVKVRAVATAGSRGAVKGVGIPLPPEGSKEPPAEEPPAEEPPAEEKPEEPPAEEPPAEKHPAPALSISPTGKDSNPCTEAAPCLTMAHAYEKASPGDLVQMLSGSYPSQTLQGSSKAGSAHVIFAPAPSASVTLTGTIYVFASHVTIEGIAVQDVVTGNYDQTPGRPNPTDVSLLDLTGRNFEIDSATDVTVEGGSWGPASACGGPYGGGNNSIRQTIPAVTPENITINNTIIHDVQSYDLIECHIEGLAIFAGNHVTVSNSKFYGNSIYDVFMQANSGGKPDNITISGNWMAAAVDDSGANGRAVGASNGVALGDSEIDENLTLEENHFNDVLQMDDDGIRPTYKNVKVVGNVGLMPFSGYACGTLAGLQWSKNVWQNDKCGSTDVNLSGAALPYFNPSNGSSLDYTLTGEFANWPAERSGGGGAGSGTAGALYLSPSGSDAGSCTQSAPCKTLARAYALAQGGETVKLAAGSYADTSLPLTSGKTAAAPVVFEPAAGASVKFSKLLNVEAHGAELKGFSFEKELFFGENAEGDVARNDALHNFEIIANGTKAPRSISILGGTAGPVADSSDNENNLIATNGPETTAVPTKITIEGVLIHEYTKVGSAHVDCLQIWAGNELTIQGNTFEKCAVFDIFLQSLPNGNAGTPKNVTIQNNFLEKTIEGFYSVFLPRHNEGNPEHFENLEIRNNSATQTISADPRATYTNAKFDGNIAPSLVFWNEATEVDEAKPNGVEADYNVLYAAGAKKIGTHDQLAPSGFVNEASLNLHLLEGAAAIGHGDPSDFPATDIEGNPRSNPPDAGAVESAG
jgi:hypothetical protein